MPIVGSERFGSREPFCRQKAPYIALATAPSPLFSTPQFALRYCLFLPCPTLGAWLALNLMRFRAAIDFFFAYERRTPAGLKYFKRPECFRIFCCRFFKKGITTAKQETVTDGSRFERDAPDVKIKDLTHPDHTSFFF